MVLRVHVNGSSVSGKTSVHQHVQTALFIDDRRVLLVTYNFFHVYSVKCALLQFNQRKISLLLLVAMLIRQYTAISVVVVFQCLKCTLRAVDLFEARHWQFPHRLTTKSNWTLELKLSDTNNRKLLVSTCSCDDLLLYC